MNTIEQVVAIADLQEELARILINLRLMYRQPTTMPSDVKMEDIHFEWTTDRAEELYEKGCDLFKSLNIILINFWTLNQTKGFWREGS